MDDREWDITPAMGFGLVTVSLIVLVLAVGFTLGPQPVSAPHEPAAPSVVRAGDPPASSVCRSSPRDTVSAGISPTAIRVASTVTLDGPGASLFADAPVGMRAIINRVNRAGGVCGRRIELVTVNDSWDRPRSHALLRRQINDEVFALLGVPAPDGLVAALEAGEIDQAGIPVVGTSGLADAEFASAWVWPVGTPTSGIVRAIAEHATARGARRFAVVRDAVHQFGHDGAAPLRNHLAHLGGQLLFDIAIDPADSDLSDEAQQFEFVCGNVVARCDAVVLLLAPSTALGWRDANPGGSAGRARPGGLTYGTHTLFTDRFASECGQWCHGMVVWTPYRPAIPPMDAEHELATFLRDVRAERQNIDTRNQSVQQAYLGAAVFVEAAWRCSPDLTRACLRQTLNGGTFTSDLAQPLRWREDDRQANHSATGYIIDSPQGSFMGWRPTS